MNEEARGMLTSKLPETSSHVQAGVFGNSARIASGTCYVLLTAFSIFSLVLIGSQLSCKPTNRNFEARSEYLVKRDAPTSVTPSVTASATPLVDFQVYQPVLTPTGPADQKFSADGSSQTQSLSVQPETASCSVTLMVHEFAYSYGTPYVGR
jgi:hypothetical protein